MNTTSDKNSLDGYLTRRSFLRVFGLAAAPVVLAGLNGCRPTDTLTETVYADWATDIDYDNPAKSLVNKPNRDPTTSLPTLYRTKSETVEQEMVDPVFDEKEEANEDSAAPQTEYNKNSQQDNGKAKKGTEEVPDKDAEEIDEELESAGKKSASVGGNEVGKDASKDATDEPEQFGSIIAFGEIANIVLLLGGKGALWAADDEFLDAAYDIYPTATINSVKSGFWSSYSSGGTTMSNKKFKKLVAALEKLDEGQRPAYLIYDGSVGCPLTDDETELLADRYDIVVKYFFLNTVKTLKNTMNWIQKALTRDDLSFEFKPKSRYDAYWEYHDGLLSAIKSCNGGVAAWNSEDNSYLNFSGEKAFSKGDAVDQDDLMWTLLINNWDRKASYEYKPGVGSVTVKSVAGIGVSTLGYAWSPISYYMQCGGVLNNAAARYQGSNSFYESKTTYRRYVWQFDPNYGPPNNKIKGGQLKDDNDLINNNEYGELLLRAQNDKCGLGKLGAGRFPVVVVTDEAFKTYMEKDRDSKTGLYSTYYLEAAATANNPTFPAMGLAYGSNKGSKMSLWCSYIGREGDDVDALSCEALDDYKGSPTKAYDILVNPHGRFSDWVKGSVESVLEAAWAYENIVAEYRDGAEKLSTNYGNSAKAIVANFYETFYGKAPSSKVISKVLEGGYAS